MKTATIRERESVEGKDCRIEDCESVSTYSGSPDKSVEDKREKRGEEKR